MPDNFTLITYTVDDKDDSSNVNDKNEDIVKKIEITNTEDNGVLASLKNSCKYRGSPISGEQLLNDW